MLNIESNKDYETIQKESKTFYLTLNYHNETYSDKQKYHEETEDEVRFKIEKSIHSVKDTDLIDFMAHIYHDRDNPTVDEQGNVIYTLIQCHILVMFKESINIDDVRALFEENSGCTVYCEPFRSGLDSSRHLIHVSDEAILEAKVPYQYDEVITYNCDYRKMVTPGFWEQEESEEDDFSGDILGSIDRKLNSIRGTKSSRKPVEQNQAVYEINERMKQRAKEDVQEKTGASILAEQVRLNSEAEDKRKEIELKNKRDAEHKALQEKERKKQFEAQQERDEQDLAEFATEKDLDDMLKGLTDKEFGVRYNAKQKKNMFVNYNDKKYISNEKFIKSMINVKEDGQRFELRLKHSDSGELPFILGHLDTKKAKTQQEAIKDGTVVAKGVMNQVALEKEKEKEL